MSNSKHMRVGDNDDALLVGSCRYQGALPSFPPRLHSPREVRVFLTRFAELVRDDGAPQGLRAALWGDCTHPLVSPRFDAYVRAHGGAALPLRTRVLVVEVSSLTYAVASSAPDLPLSAYYVAERGVDLPPGASLSVHKPTDDEVREDLAAVWAAARAAGVRRLVLVSHVALPCAPGVPPVTARLRIRSLLREFAAAAPLGDGDAVVAVAPEDALPPSTTLADITREDDRAHFHGHVNVTLRAFVAASAATGT